MILSAVAFMCSLFPQAALGDVVLLGPLGREALLAILAGGVAGIWLLYRRVAAKVNRRRRLILTAIRAAFLAVLMVMLAVPAIATFRSRTGSVYTAVLIDTSRSMSLGDAAAGQDASRLELARQMLNEQGLLSQLAAQSDVAVYAFDGDARRIKLVEGAGGARQIGKIDAAGSYTHFYRGIDTVDQDLRGLPLASVVMLTDGNIRKPPGKSSDSGGGTAQDAAGILKARGVPLHVVGLGEPNPPRDLEVRQVDAPRKVRRNSEVEVFVTVRHTGFTEPFDLQVRRDGQPQPVLTRSIKPAAGGDVQRVKLVITPDHDQAAGYTVSIPAAPGELATQNNTRRFNLDVQDERLPVLYIEGSPRMEYRFLQRALFRDKDFRVVGQLRRAKGDFYPQNAGPSEQYLKKGFPQTAEQLFAFHAVILGDIEAANFTAEQLDLLERFVRERGGGLVMLGGVNSFGLGKYALTPLAKLLPIEISPADGQYSDERYNAKLMAEGLKHPVMQLVNNPQNNKLLWEKMPPLVGITPAGAVKAGAQLLLAHERTAQPVLAVQNYGAGRVAAFTSGGSWYWQMSRPAADEFQEKFWKQLVRWLAVGAREQLTLETDSDVYPRHGQVQIRASVNGKDLRPDNDAVILAVVVDPLGNKHEMQMDWILSQEGVYECSFTPTEDGPHQVSLQCDKYAAEAKALASDFRVSENIDEFNDASLKEDTLRDMAKITGGRYYRPQEAAAIPAEVAKSIQEVKDQGVRPELRQIWDTPLLLAALLVLAGAEWFIRRRSGLA